MNQWQSKSKRMAKKLLQKVSRTNSDWRRWELMMIERRRWRTHLDWRDNRWIVIEWWSESIFHMTFFDNRMNQLNSFHFFGGVWRKHWNGNNSNFETRNEGENEIKWRRINEKNAISFLQFISAQKIKLKLKKLKNWKWEKEVKEKMKNYLEMRMSAKYEVEFDNS